MGLGNHFLCTNLTNQKKQIQLINQAPHLPPISLATQDERTQLLMQQQTKKSESILNIMQHIIKLAP